MAYKDTHKTRMASEAVSESGLRSEPREVCVPVLGVAGCTWTDPQESEWVGAVKTGPRGGEGMMQQSGVPGEAQHSAGGPSRLARGPRSRDACRCWSPRPRAPRVRRVTRPGPSSPAPPAPGPVSRGHRLGSQQEVSTDTLSASQCPGTPVQS